MTSVLVLGVCAAGLVFAICLVILTCVLWKYVTLKKAEKQDAESNDRKEGLPSESIKTPDFAIPVYYYKVQPELKGRTRSAEFDTTDGERKLIPQRTSASHIGFTEHDIRQLKKEKLLLNVHPSPKKRKVSASRLETKAEEVRSKIERQMMSHLRKQRKKESRLSEEGHLSVSSCDISSEESEKSEELFDSASIGSGRRKIGRRRKLKSTEFEAKYKNEGKITLACEYCEEEKVLKIHVKKLSGIAARREITETNPYVQLFLEPGKKQKQKSKYHKETKDADIDESFQFVDISKEDLNKYKLKIKVLNHGRFRKSEILGEVDIEISAFELKAKATYDVDLFVKKPESFYSSINVTLSHQATFSKLEVTINEVKHLPKKGQFNPDSFVVVTLYKEDEVAKKNTIVQRNTRDPVFNKTFDFFVITDNQTPLNTFSLVVTVINHSLIGHNSIIGHVVFSLSSSQDSAAEHWRDAQNEPYQRISRWHSLQASDEV